VKQLGCPLLISSKRSIYNFYLCHQFGSGATVPQRRLVVKNGEIVETRAVPSA
jgi:hypothetical protein